MQETDALREARHEMEVCNACRYCEGFCAVFPAVNMRREFSAADLSYLANLCHNCRGCYYACQYAPPHEWGINVPRTLARVRAASYAEHAWPPAMARAFERNGVLVAGAIAAGISLLLLLTLGLVPHAAMHGAHRVAPGAFYQVIPLWVMQVVGLATFGFSVVAMAKGAVSFWRDAGTRQRIGPRAILAALHDVTSLRNLGGGGGGCNDASERFSMRRRRLHHAMMYGFLLCFAATCTGFFYDSFLGWAAPYPFFSVPVVLGTLGGIGLLVGTGGLFAMKLVDNPEPAARELLGADIALLGLLFLAAFTGLALLALRGTADMGVALAVHLGVILALFVTLPYSKMVHGVYRGLALLRAAVEQRAGVG
ncbi:MAG: tricarballylate utilization 4Fe-4S protein TcuB [Rhodospirillales bacterium]|nr:tricarballylate utilization 4Fe-4S protein TcuB [Rhodospirillales bacterium]